MLFARLTALTTLVVTALATAGAGEPRVSEPVDWLQSYLRIDTSNPPGNEHLGAAFLRQVLREEGFETRLIVTPTGRTNLYARLAAAAPGEGALVLLHHIDVVPPGDGWSSDPFSGEIRQGSVWGRGAVDDKSLGIAHLAAIVDLKRQGVRPRRDVIFLAVADEESGGENGAAWLLDTYPDLFPPGSAVLGEGGQNRAYGDHLAWWGIEVAQKRPLWLRATASGRGGHGSILNLHTAPHRLIRGLGRLVDRQPELRVSPEVRAYFEAVAPMESTRFNTILAELDDIVASPAPGRRLLPGLPTFLADTIQVNVVDAGSRINVAPAEVSALIDVRMLPDTDADALLAELQNLVGDKVRLEVLVRSPRVEPSPTDHPVYRCLERELSPRAPVVPAFIPGVTDSRHFRGHGIPAYGFSPFVLQGEPLRGIHGPDERIPVELFERGVETTKRLVRACATG